MDNRIYELPELEKRSYPENWSIESSPIGGPEDYTQEFFPSPFPQSGQEFRFLDRPDLAQDSFAHLYTETHIIARPLEYYTDNSGNVPVLDVSGFNWGFVSDDERREAILRWKAKKQRILSGEANTKKYSNRKKYADARPRINGRFVSPEEYREHISS